MTDNIKLEIGNTDLYHTGMRVKWDPYKERFTTGTLDILNLKLEDVRLAIGLDEGTINGVVLEAVTYQEFGATYNTFMFIPEDKAIKEFEIDIFDTIFTLLTPVAVSNF